MLDKLNSVEANYEELMALLASPSVQSDSNEYRKHAKALAELQPLVETAREYKTLLQRGGANRGARQRAPTRRCASSPRKNSPAEGAARRPAGRVRDAARSRRIRTIRKTSCSKSGPAPAATKPRCSPTSSSGCTASSPRSRAGESSHVDQRKRRRGIKEVIATIEGRGVYSKLKYESGVHRVQRVPATETAAASIPRPSRSPSAGSGRVEVQIDPKDLRIDTFCSPVPAVSR